MTVIQRFGSALNLNVHFQMLLLHGMYMIEEAGHAVLRRVPEPGALEKRGLIERDMHNAWLSDFAEADPLGDLIGHPVTHAPTTNMPTAIYKIRGKLGRETYSTAHTETDMRTNAKTKQVSRRKLLGQALVLPAMAAAATAADSATAARGSHGWREVRRVVTSYDAAGRTVVLQDGAPTNSFEMSGTRITRLWESSGVPVSLPLGPDLGATAGNAYRDGFTGTSFYIAELPGGARAPSIPLHSNATLDYMAILSGKIAFMLDKDRELILKAGDTLVQGGNLHTWANRWRESCLLLFVVVTGQAERPT